MGIEQFRDINWLPIKYRVNQCIAVTAYNFKNNLSPAYMSDIYLNNNDPNVRTRRSVNSLMQPNYLNNVSRKALSYLGPKIWNDLDQGVKISPSTNSFKHNLKKEFFTKVS